ncbi:cytochrome P450 oxidoreductase [Pochonia chlamydosporia 170]|uniref:Cytochrome P450 oxidoreductase n=1 Tax=Pochonia chlamydosporia 170 TaxID=1380566 RepID=A0A179F0A1_METCM|nr:cytochrome P450 oxidoreductase [Pochonia chlamydosporia 170]OAQ58690.1 cytochrome P450 oxidoreductase [Pochonia chlamydosporia 170]
MEASIIKHAGGFILQNPITSLVIVVLLYILKVSVYRLLSHPLAGFPGPKIAALTVWYEFYYDAIQRGRYTFEIQKMHDHYGPIVRISPDELHINYPAFINELYAGGSKKRDKYTYFSSQFGIPDSVFGTADHDLHRLRRGALNKFFSKAAVTRLEPIVHNAIEKLVSQLETYAGADKPAPMTMAFSCMTTDVVTEYAFAKSYDFLNSPTFEPNFHRAIIAGSDMGPWIKQFPWLITLMNKLPKSIVMCINPEAAIYVQFQEDIRRQIRQVQDQIASGAKEDSSSRTIFHELLTGNLPNEEKSISRLWQEGQIVVGAGTETTAWTLSATLFYVLNDNRILHKLQKELAAAMPDSTKRISCNELEQLPYLSAIVSEGLRLSCGVSTRLQRINPTGPFYFKPSATTTPSGNRGHSAAEFIIPKGTPVGMTSTLIHTNPELFPDPHAFRPERWLDDNGQRHHELDGYLCPFLEEAANVSAFSMLAYTELYMCLGLLFRRLGSRLELFETTEQDVEIYYDRFVPTPRDGTQGIRVLINE